MKFFLSFVSLFFTLTTFCADLYVKEFGGGGAYSTINDAMAVAAAGDRILVAAKAGNAPYIENIDITKPLQILTATNGGRYTIQGNVTIATTLPAGSTVVLDGISISSGNISAAASTAAINVFLVNSILSSGTVSFGTRINATIANNTITTPSSGYAVTICNGKILGNSINAFNQGILVSNDAVVSLDTINVVGNRVELSTDFTLSVFNGLTWNNSRNFFNISNNYFNQLSNNYAGGGGQTYNMVNFGTFKPGANTNQYNNFNNNSIKYVQANLSTVTLVGVAGTLDARCNVLNNLVIHTVTGLKRSFNISGTPQFSYNTGSGGATFNAGSTAVDGTNTFTATIYAVTTNGCVNSVNNTGHPDPIFTDLDLTRNDIGPCGGSYNITVNFFTPGTAGTGKVHWLEAPRRVSQGSTLGIKAEGHDR